MIPIIYFEKKPGFWFLLLGICQRTKIDFMIQKVHPSFFTIAAFVWGRKVGDFSSPVFHKAKVPPSLQHR